MVTKKIETDDILHSSRKGDRKAFQKLVETFQGYAFSLAVRYLGNEEDAVDIVQETFIRVWKHLADFDFRCKFTTWLYRIVINLCHDRVKSRNRHDRVLAPMPETTDNLPLQCSDDLENKSINEELVTIITNFAADLTPKRRAVFVLRDLEDMSIEEVAQILGMSKGAVKSNLFYARQDIRQRLEQLEIKNKERQR
jgi:RNA polymerase sigma-70 factor (ECF subfamily)